MILTSQISPHSICELINLKFKHVSGCGLLCAEKTSFVIVIVQKHQRGKHCQHDEAIRNEDMHHKCFFSAQMELYEDCS